jgi:hypothetical protein
VGAGRTGFDARRRPLRDGHPLGRSEWHLAAPPGSAPAPDQIADERGLSAQDESRDSGLRHGPSCPPPAAVFGTQSAVIRYTSKERTGPSSRWKTVLVPWYQGMVLTGQ